MELISLISEAWGQQSCIRTSSIRVMTSLVSCSREDFKGLRVSKTKEQRGWLMASYFAAFAAVSEAISQKVDICARRKDEFRSRARTNWWATKNMKEKKTAWPVNWSEVANPLIPLKSKLYKFKFFTCYSKKKRNARYFSTHFDVLFLGSHVYTRLPTLAPTGHAHRPRPPLTRVPKSSASEVRFRSKSSSSSLFTYSTCVNSSRFS